MKIISFDSFIFNFDFIAKPTRTPPPVDGEVEVYVSTFKVRQAPGPPYLDADTDCRHIAYSRTSRILRLPVFGLWYAERLIYL